MGAPIQMNRFIPNLARLCAPLRPLLCKTKEWKWTDQHENTFQTIKKEIQEITEIKFFKRTQQLRIACDASRDGLGRYCNSERSKNGGQHTPHQIS